MPQRSASGEVPDAVDPKRMDPVDLSFDAHNPRLQGRAIGYSQEEILGILWREFAVDEIVLSIAANGYFDYEPLFVVREDSKNVVVEGNRRLAAVKLLLDPSLRAVVKATQIPEISSEAAQELRALPVVYTTRDEIWRYVGFKHVNGPKQWDALSKAEYIAWVHNEVGISLDDIARQIGDRHSTVARLYNGLMALQEVEASGLWNRDRRTHRRFFFSHLYTALDYPGFQSYLGIDTSRGTTSDTPIPEDKIPELAEVCTWLFGDKEKDVPPRIVSQNPDLRILDEAIQDGNGVDALRRGLPLSVALDISRGDERILRENLVSAKASLQTAKARLVTGYSGERAARSNAEDIFALAESILDEMDLIEDRIAASKVAAEQQGRRSRWSGQRR
jgi:hypothetical protein